MSAPRRMVLVHAHPDDETITCGGLMARAVEAGVGVTLVTCTLGEQGEVIPPSLQALEGSPDLAAHRAGELDQACAALGVTDHRLLGGRGRWHDSGMVATGEGIRAAAPADLGEGAFSRRADVDLQVAQLVEILTEVEPDVVVSYDATGGYGHPDHVRAHEIAGGAVEKLDPLGDRIGLWATAAAHDEVEAGLTALGRRAWLPLPVPPVADLPTVPDATVTVRVALGPARVRKLAALRAHATQIRVFDDGREPPAFALSNDLAQPVLAAEHFVLLRGPGGAAATLGALSA
ncbi:N-acetyl-1-D-myo-inositol-2-amino-2-deoxy-alpha-D-glucopyranoside deacetylase [Actinomycetospora endophytica]|uniref:N-acetyl-1-D-myo-inositol-2-amino-2-deoxy-alpha-D-glucopyranoside deacetylase n=1 Tax=Actinomycetospora endophytica TaxID=2291215 RepID=A0ABS8P7S5_9PSEU|nr:N-acetyl-1-D-myo-inositol-2-amino-2-deoxy-alpha-D-glucopyranoside deacetylase [Actinomycetospora endophytica]MCD2194301.1 N-acetyl-1-D-myo-inositol-2-amino-2-deoxy-alpha-D-glucopyranoside deacetylase [Actinomycetospora endophytica]